MTIQTPEQLELVEKVKTAIRTRPENWDQREWVKTIDFTRPEEERDEICGTAMCTAGWVVIEAGVGKVEFSEIKDEWALDPEATTRVVDIVDVKTGKWIAAEERAAELLGLTYEQRHEIFYATDVVDPDEMCNLIDAVIAWPHGDMPWDWQDERDLIVRNPRSFP